MMCFTHLILIIFILNCIYGLNETKPTFSVLSVKSDKEFKKSNNAFRYEDYEWECLDNISSSCDYNDHKTSTISEEKVEDKEHENISYDKNVHILLNSFVNFITKTSSEYNEQMNKTNKDARSTWIAYSNVFQKFIDSAIEFGFNLAVKPIGDINWLNECTTTLAQIVRGLKEQKSWAAKFLDSTGHPFVSGVFDGSYTNLGDYDQCLSITAEPYDFVGQYCLLKYGAVLPPKPQHLILQSSVFNFSDTPMENTFFNEFTRTAHAFYDRYTRIGICVPSVCKHTDIEKLVRKFITDERINLLVDKCHIKKSIHFTTLQIVILSVFVFLALIITIGTTFDLLDSDTVRESREQHINFQNDKKKFILKMVLSFSVYTNGKQLFSTKTSQEITIRSISGIKVMTMAWIVWANTYFLSIKETFLFSRNYMFATEELPFQLIQNGWVLSDTFFIIGALLMTTSLLKSLKDSNNRINIIQMIFNRIFRLLPSICVTVMLLFIITSVGNGPLWEEYFDPQVNMCYKYWWKTLLFINNWYNFDNICLPHTWYMSADLQLFIVSLFFVVLINKKHKFALCSLIFAVIIACLAVVIRTFVMREPPTVLYNTPSEREVLDNVSKVQVHTYIHLGPYLVGIILGFVLNEKRESNDRNKIHSVINNFFWMLSIVIGVTIMLITYWLNRGSELPLLFTAIYAGLHRIVWSLCVAWVIFACETGNGGPINTFLSWKFFIPLEKLCFMVYLMHFLVIWFRLGYSRAPLPFSHYTMLCEFIVNLIMSTLLSIVTYLSVEAPIMTLLRNHLQNMFQWANTKIYFSNSRTDLISESIEMVELSRFAYVNDAYV